MRILYSGFDSIYFAVKGALAPAAEKHLAHVKERAVTTQNHEPFTCHDESARYHLQPNGKRGGFAYVVDTGQLGSILSFKSGLSRNDWNGFVEIRSASLLCYGWEKAIETALNQFKALGFHVVEISMNRVDYCIDFLNANIRLDPAHFVAHSRVKKTCYHKGTLADPHMHKSSVTRSEHVQSITLGKMPGRQVIIYDKQAEVIEKRKTYWFKAWGVNPNDPTLDIYRVEIRAGKNRLKADNITSLNAFKRHIGLTLLNASKAVRYVLQNPDDTNITRAPLHPLWEAVQNRLKSALKQHSVPIEPEALYNHMRKAKAQEMEKLVIGNVGGLLGCLNADADNIGNHIEYVLVPTLKAAEGDSEHPLWKSYGRAKIKWDIAR